MQTAVSHFLETLLNTWFPPVCIGCGCTGSSMCATCELQLHVTHESPEPWIYTPFIYSDPLIQKMVHLLKTRNHKESFCFAAHAMYEILIEALYEFETYHTPVRWILVPIPITKKREQERGFNQSKLLAMALKDKLGFSIKDLLVKIKHTKKQALTDNKRERMQNIVGSFTIKNFSGNPNEYGVIIIDDVTTTGATLQEAKKVLTAAGFNTIIASTFAYQPLVYR